MEVLFTDRTGFVGRNLLAFLKEKYDIVALTR
jgi:nucleoside-diphosphate-sugar epimerase